MNLIQLQRRGVVRHDLADCGEQRVDGSITAHRRRCLDAVDRQRQDGALRPGRPAINLDLNDFDRVMTTQNLVIDQGNDVLIPDRLLGVGEVFEAFERIAELVVR